MKKAPAKKYPKKASLVALIVAAVGAPAYENASAH
jgi:hypothetical protein